MNNPETFNSDRMDEIARAAFCKAAQYGIELIQETMDKKSALPQFEDRIAALGTFMAAATSAMSPDDNKDDGYSDDDDTI